MDIHSQLVHNRIKSFSDPLLGHSAQIERGHRWIWQPDAGFWTRLVDLRLATPTKISLVSQPDRTNEIRTWARLARWGVVIASLRHEAIWIARSCLTLNTKVKGDRNGACISVAEVLRYRNQTIVFALFMLGSGRDGDPNARKKSFVW
jgi:hypothetical protein